VRPVFVACSTKPNYVGNLEGGDPSVVSGTREAVVKRLWYAMIDGRIDEKLTTHVGGRDERLVAGFARVEDKIDATRVGLRREFQRNLEAARAESKADLAATRAESKADLVATRAELKDEIANTRAELKDEIASTRTELKDDIANTRAELKDEIASTRVELKDEIASTRAEFRDGLKHTRVELKQDLQGMESRLVAQIARLSETGIGRGDAEGGESIRES